MPSQRPQVPDSATEKLSCYSKYCPNSAFPSERREWCGILDSGYQPCMHIRISWETFNIAEARGAFPRASDFNFPDLEKGDSLLHKIPILHFLAAPFCPNLVLWGEKSTGENCCAPQEPMSPTFQTKHQALGSLFPLSSQASSPEFATLVPRGGSKEAV